MEEYKFLEKITSEKLILLFTEYKIFEYVLKHYDSLHTLGGRAIVDDINLFVAARQE